MSATVYVLIWEDRHVDTDARVFATKDGAVEAARRNTRQYLGHYGSEPSEVNEELTPGMAAGGWLYYCKVGGDDGPSGYVFAREVEK